MEPKKIHYRNPYPNEFLNTMDSILLKMFKPYSYTFDTFLSCFYPTTKELQEPYWLIPVYLLVLPLSAIGLVVLFPYLLVVLLVWWSFQWKKTLYRYSYTKSEGDDERNMRPNSTYTFMTTNFCLLPESLSKYNNLDNTYWRSTQLGRKLVNAKSSPGEMNGFTGMRCNGNNNNKPKTKTAPSFDTSILSGVDPPDIVLIQEGSWVLEFGVELGKELHKVYPYIVHDIAKHSFPSNLCLGTSGLMLASKYPLLDIHFREFKDSCKQCVFASKGVLHVKVSLGKNSNGQNVVGFLYNTHLQAYQGTRPTQSYQMDEALKWITEYRQRMTSPGEIVAFDVLGGDFNVDNMSPVDERSTNHDLFREYRDVGRVHAGQDCDWAVGTEFRQLLLYQPQISTPAGLKQALEDPILLQTYILDADVVTATSELGVRLARRDEHGNVIPSEVGGKRRIDYLMFNEEDRVEVLSYNFVTQFAKLTDHIPVFMKLKIADDKL